VLLDAESVTRPINGRPVGSLSHVRPELHDSIALFFQAQPADLNVMIGWEGVRGLYRVQILELLVGQVSGTKRCTTSGLTQWETKPHDHDRRHEAAVESGRGVVQYVGHDDLDPGAEEAASEIKRILHTPIRCCSTPSSPSQGAAWPATTR
jgi:hypothetical protein